jgi:outer membrane protein assembly factor BamB
MKKVAIALAGVAVMAVALASWTTRRTECWRPIEPSEIDNPAQLGDLHLDLSKIEPASWVQIYQPSEAESGFNLVFFGRRLPMVIDMNGRVVHAWPEVRAAGRVRLDREGNLLVIGTDNLVKEYDWEGRLTWYYQLPDEHHLPHHDLIRLQNGNCLILAHDGHTHTDYLHEVDREGRVVWDWMLHRHRKSFPEWDEDSTDPSHSNSIRELPPNRWYDAGDQRFRPGNILVSARNLNTIFIIDKRTGDVVWRFSEGMDRQHEAVMVGEGNVGEGLIMVFNNGLEGLYASRRSRVQTIDPVAGEVVWEYASEHFFSSVGGVVQPLPEGNIFVTSSHGGRVFEITPDSEIVWQWVPPYRPMRVERIPYEHCPQLADLGRPHEDEVLPVDAQPYIDMDLYNFALPEEMVIREVAGKERKLVPWNSGCRKLRIPPDAMMRSQFGIDTGESAGGWNSARFGMTLDDGEVETTIIDETITPDSKRLWRQRRVDLSEFGAKRVNVCLSAEVDGGPADSQVHAVWANPVIESKTQRPPRLRSARRVSEQERKLQKQQLEALGYVN